MKLKAVIIDDDPVILVIHKMLVKKHKIDFDPIVVKSAEEALVFFENQSDNQTLYLLFLDINMPNLNGWDFLDRVSVPNVAVFMITSSTEKKDQEKASSYKEVIGFFSKPLTNNTLIEIKKNPKLKSMF